MLVSNKFLELAYAILKNKADLIRDLIIRLDCNFINARNYVLSCKGRVVVTSRDFRRCNQKKT
jgi:hypothetical protein